MATTQLSGPYRLQFDDISAVVRLKSAGAFALGYVNDRNTFCIRYVGRSDDDVKARLCEMIGSEQFFKFSYFVSSVGAFLKECELFHDFKPIGNRFHPERPRGTSLVCPRCHTDACLRPRG